jgi:hypothetical protein
MLLSLLSIVQMPTYFTLKGCNAACAFDVAADGPASTRRKREKRHLAGQSLHPPQPVE